MTKHFWIANAAIVASSFAFAACSQGVDGTDESSGAFEAENACRLTTEENLLEAEQLTLPGGVIRFETTLKNRQTVQIELTRREELPMDAAPVTWSTNPLAGSESGVAAGEGAGAGAGEGDGKGKGTTFDGKIGIRAMPPAQCVRGTYVPFNIRIETPRGERLCFDDLPKQLCDAIADHNNVLGFGCDISAQWQCISSGVTLGRGVGDPVCRQFPGPIWVPCSSGGGGH